MKLATRLTRRVVLKAVSGVGLTLVGCGEGAGELLDNLLPVHPLDESEDVEMPPPREQDLPFYDPLVLYGTTVLQPNSEASPNVAALKNPHGLPMEIQEIRFRIYPQNDEDNFFFALTGLAIAVKLDLGGIAIANGVPLTSFGSTRDNDEVFQSGGVQFGGTAIYSQTNPALDGEFIAVPYTYSWRLKYPLYIPPGAVLSPTLIHLGQLHFPVVVDVIYLGRSLPEGTRAPRTAMVPWVTAYQSVSFDNLVSTPAGLDTSNELDIVNPFSVPLEVVRLRGAVSFNVNSAASSQGGGAGPGIVESREDHRFRLGKVKMRTSRGDEVARNPTVFNGLFPYSWRAWDIPSGWFMEPGEFYKVNLAVAATDYTPRNSGGIDQNGRIQYGVSVIGFRSILGELVS